LAILRASPQERDLLLSFGLSESKLSSILTELKGSNRVTDEMPEVRYNVIEKYSTNLCQKAKEGKLDPVIDREQELSRVIQILSRRTKNNPVLIGEAGVGKTAIVEGLAQKIVKGDVPETLKDKEIISLDLGALIAGTRFRGEFENRVKAFIQEVKSSNKYILFIDEVHTLIGAGAAEGAIDASNLLKSPLARGELRVIGATTISEYQKYIERDPALERRFQPVVVSEPSIEDSIEILKGIKGKYEIYHGIKISDQAIVAAVNLSARYIPDRFLPDKAIDLIDEAAAARRVETTTIPKQLKDLRKQITRLEIERSAKKNDPEQVKKITRKINRLKAKERQIFTKWYSEKTQLENLHNLAKKIEQLEEESELAKTAGDLERAAQIKYGELPRLKKEYLKCQKKFKSTKKEFVKQFIDQEGIAQIISSWTGIPVTKMLQSEAEKLANAEKILSKRVVGQQAAISAVANALRRARAGLSDKDKPIASFMFLGPTGVGKTELAKALAEFMFNDEKALIRIDMSEYMERHSVARLIGSPPGYVGYVEGGQLTKQVQHRPYSLILFDEIEKAHPEVFNLLLQLLDEGRLTDGRGKTVNFRNCIVILTSNVGSQYFKEVSSLGFEAEPLKLEAQTKSFKLKVKELVNKTFKPEFLNRLDEIIIFDPLTKSSIRKIVDIQLNLVKKRLAERNIELEIDPSLKTYLVKHGFSPEFGARPIRRLIQKVILDELASKIVEGEIKDGQKVKLSFKKEGLLVRV